MNGRRNGYVVKSVEFIIFLPRVSLKYFAVGRHAAHGPQYREKCIVIIICWSWGVSGRHLLKRKLIREKYHHLRNDMF